MSATKQPAAVDKTITPLQLQLQPGLAAMRQEAPPPPPPPPAAGPHLYKEILEMSWPAAAAHSLPAERAHPPQIPQTQRTALLIAHDDTTIHPHVAIPPRFAATGGITLPQRPVMPTIVAASYRPPVMLLVEEEVWQCHKCKRDNLAGKARCGSCQAWKGGKREGFGKKAGTQYTLVPQESWTCPCGNNNNAKKVRCTKCQKWRGGRRMHKGTIASKWHAKQLATLSSTTPPTPWTCDKCGNANDASKVRCMACPRWKNGKRPKYSQKAMRNSMPPPLTTTMAAGGGGGAHCPPAIHDGDWFCAGCNHLNDTKKQRCGSCQRWKFGKRENMLKKNRPVPNMVQTTVGHQLAGAGTFLPGMHPPENLPQNAAPQPMDPQQSWSCSCGHINMEQSRCSSCQKWKGGKRENIRRKSPTQVNTKAAAGPGIPLGASVMPNQPNMPWKCCCCGDDNGCKKLRCRTCQSWKNGKKQLSQRAEAGVVAPSVPATGQSFIQLPVDGTLCTPQWECHGCNAQVLGTKNRCPSCKSWKGGFRLNLGKSKVIPEPWMCHGCQKQNNGNKVRCANCQCWRGGGRPDVAARKEKDQELNGSWICDRQHCQRPNKESKARCGGCQRWRGGQRPDMRKSAKTYRATVPNSVSQPYQLPTQDTTMKHATPLPPTQMQHPMTLVAPPVAPSPALRGQALMNTSNAVNVPVQSQILMETSQNRAPSQVPIAQAPATDGEKTSIGAWTCTKCTCDNLATEMKCKICDSPWDGVLV
eukprot:CAMPEP_0201887198 /NCGR_PEP_ID=MMETSP0902-20130614/24357_1 /ASSEMBLY_ACC=CAM_ASM_000551 /TAXON_ID=420261 /ORGANISM="Thalassiosira antarctica, Strain CCMP982" /LENGTH=755 /DNA_ID=CAMNT_0048417057 /DNA_START=15 /DNA_END=2282 /DNA_ORIENTATION=+